MHPDTLNATKKTILFMFHFSISLRLEPFGKRFTSTLIFQPRPSPWGDEFGRYIIQKSLCFHMESSVNSCVSIWPIASLSRSQADGGGEGYSRDDGIADIQFIYLKKKKKKSFYLNGSCDNGICALPGCTQAMRSQCCFRA